MFFINSEGDEQEAVREAGLILIMLGAVIFGYIQMKQLDRFLEKNRKSVEEDLTAREPDCVMLTEEVSDEELLKEVKDFRRKYADTRIVLYHSPDTKRRKA